MIERVFEVVKQYDDLLRVEIGETYITVGVRRYNGGSKERFTVQHRTRRIQIPLGGSYARGQAEERHANRSC